MRNPYVVGTVAYGHCFYGREALVAGLLADAHHCVYLIGTRHSGKTSLLWRLQDCAPFLTLYLNLQATGCHPASIAHELLRQARRKNCLRRALPQSVKSLPGAVTALATAAESADLTVIMLWDEAEVLLGLDPELLQRLRAVLQSERSLRTILAATKTLVRINDRCRSWTTPPFLFGFAPHYLSPFTDDEAEALIRQVQNPEGPVRVSKHLAAKIRQLTGNHPYLLQFLCSRLFVAPGRLRTVTPPDLALNDSLAAVLRVDFENLAHDEQHILRCLAREGPLTHQDLREHSDLEIEHLDRFLRGLEDLGYVRTVAGRTEIGNYFLQSWLLSESAGVLEAISERASLEVIDPPAPPPLVQRAPGMDYERGLAALKAQLEHTNRHHAFNLLEARLLDNLDQESRFGSTEQIRSDRARILDPLNRLADDVLGTSFNSLCRATEPVVVQSKPTPNAAKLGASPTPQAITPPVQARLQHLPFNQLTWVQFEALCAALVEASPLTVSCHLYGVAGNAQQGIDVVAVQRSVDGGTETWVYQCKRYAQYTPTALKAALAEITYPADYAVVCLSIAATTALRDVVSARERTFLWDEADLTRKLKAYPWLVEDFFGAAWRAAVCGG